MNPPSAAAPALESAPATGAIPDYLSRTYRWAYLSRRTLPWLDQPLVVSAILWGNAGRLMRAAVAEFEPGQRVLQAACVYGAFSKLLAERVGGAGALEVVDVAPLQVANVRRKLGGLSQVSARQADLAEPDGVGERLRDGVCCFFLLHEVPPDARARIVDNLLAAVLPGGKVVFVDYHRPHRWHPLRPVMAQVFRRLEPYAPSLLGTDIEALSSRSGAFEWKKTTVFGGLYQKLVGIRRD